MGPTIIKLSYSFFVDHTDRVFFSSSCALKSQTGIHSACVYALGGAGREQGAVIFVVEELLLQ